MLSNPSLSPDAGRLPHRLAVAVSLVLATAALGSKAQADEPKQLPKISVQDELESTNKIDHVSSPKFTQPLIDTPQTIAIIGPEILRQQRATTLSQALRNTPGVTLLLGENGNTSTGDSIFMRGFDTQGSIFVDGIRDIGSVSRDTFNTEQIEVAKGPSGPDYGRSAASGYVNLASKVPVLDQFARSTLSYGTAENARVTGDVNHAFEDRGMAMRLNVMAQDGEVDGRDFIEQESWAVAPSFALGLNDDTRAYVYLLHTEQDNTPDGGVPTIGHGSFLNSFQTLGVRAPKPDSENFYGAVSDFEDVKATMATVRIEHDFSENLRLRNTSRWGKLEQFYILTGIAPYTAANFPSADPDTWTVNRSRQVKDQYNRVLTNQTNLTAALNTGGIEHAITSGFEFIREEQNTRGYIPASLGTMPAASTYNPNRHDPVTGLDPARSPAYTKGSTTTYGLYVFDTLTFSEKWEFTAGVRLDDYKTEFDSIAISNAGVRTNTSEESSDTLFAYKVGALYKPVPNGSIYLSHATSQQPPGGANFNLSSSATNAANPIFDPQEASNLELGTKWDLLDNALTLTVAIFRSENKNEVFEDDDAPGQGVQAGKRRVEGIEVGVVGQITDAFEISAGVAKMDTKVLKGTDAQTGQAINWSPELTFTSWATYHLPFGLSVGGGVRYVDTVARSINNAPTLATANLLEVPDYWIIDAMLEYRVNDHLTVQLNGYNLADEEYIATLNNSGARYKPGQPRSALLSFNVDF